MLEEEGSNPCHLVDVHSQMVTINVARGGENWLCRVVYASPIPLIRKNFWSYLVEFAARCECSLVSHW